MGIALLLVAGLVALYFGAEWLVRGSSTLALRLGLTPLLVGLTVVAYGTSAPELIVSLAAAWQGQADIAIGNAVGSNIVNIGLILGLTAVLCPIRVQLQVLKLDTPVMVGGSVLFLVFFLDHQISRWEAGCFVVLLVLYTLVNIRLARRKGPPEVEQAYAATLARKASALGWCFLMIVGGLLALAVGARLFVLGATRIAELLGVSQAIIGLTVVAIGTSLPELITSAVAAARKQADIAVGNIVGSTICNVLAILGFAGVLAGPLDGAGVAITNVTVMVVFTLGMALIAWSGFKLTRWEGGLLLAGYVSYLAWLWPK
jgi:cation:H+ antiporter